MNKYKALSISIGIIYLWFGALKLFPGLSPAETIASDTVEVISLNILPKKVGYYLLAIFEIFIGVGLIVFKFRFFFTKVAISHLICTFIPLFIFCDLSFTTAPYGLTIIGQYIIKNIVIIMALLILIPEKVTPNDI